MKIAKQFIKKLFGGRNKNSILSIVALVECIILLGITTFSWIESASSLVIKGEDLPIGSNLNYRFDITEGATNMVDLSTYFRPTALYQMAQASSVDGNNFYFKKANSTTNYRKGDTTDYNTSYYNIDFQVHNKTNESYNYYFEKADMLTVTSDDEALDESDLNVAAGAFRIAVTAGTNTSNTRIYSRDSYTNGYSAVNTVSGGTAKANYTALTNSLYVYNKDNNNANAYVFSSTNGGDDTKVNVKIWFEERDPGYQALSAEKKKALLGATVSIDMKFVNAASNFQTFFFDDYTFSSKAGYEGKHVTSEDPDNKKLYFYYNYNGTDSLVPMTTTISPDESVTRWVTASDEGDPTPRISDDMKDNLETNPTGSYFFYGTVDDNGNPNITYRWNITAPANNNSGVYIFKALSVNKVASNTVGYGVWDTERTPLQLYYFKDHTVTATDAAYNAGGYEFVDKAGQGRLYLNEDGTANYASTNMYYDSTTDLWKGYYLTTTTPHFIYLKADNFTAANTMVKWQAGEPTVYSGEETLYSGKYIYTGLGYTGTGLVDAQDPGGTTGVGTWGETERVLFSTELVDASMNKDYRYKVGIHSGTTSTYYYMTKYNNNLTWGVYVPKGSGNAQNEYLSFQRYSSYSETSEAGEWNKTQTVRDISSIFYATDMAATTSNGQWHIGVVVDGSADNVIDDVLTNVEGSALEYSVDGGTTYEPMTQLDNYRWITKDFASTVKTINYRWTAYQGVGVNEAVFTYGHDVDNGIYFNITE